MAGSTLGAPLKGGRKARPTQHPTDEKNIKGISAGLPGTAGFQSEGGGEEKHTHCIRKGQRCTTTEEETGKMEIGVRTPCELVGDYSVKNPPAQAVTGHLEGKAECSLFTSWQSQTLVSISIQLLNVPGKDTLSICWPCHYKGLQPGRLNYRQAPHCSECWKSKTQEWAAWFPRRPLSLTCTWLASPCIFTGLASILLFLKGHQSCRVRAHLMTSFYIITSLKTLFPKAVIF